LFLLPGFISGIQDFIDHLPAYVTSARETLQEWTEKYGRLLPADIRDQIGSAVEGLVPTIISNVQRLVPRALGVVFNTFSFFLGLFSLPIWLFFVIRDRNRLVASFYSLFPPGPRQMARDIVGIVDRVLGGYIRARLTMALVVGVMVSIGLLILGVKFALILGTLAACLELVPIIGPFLGAIPAIIVGLATSPDKVLWIIVVFLVVQLLENNLLDPVIQAGFLKLHPAIIILALVIASAVFGVLGMFVAGPMVALAREVFRYLYSRWSESTTEVPANLEKQDESG
jgi:predicted PurR-regulated permease PerM